MDIVSYLGIGSNLGEAEKNCRIAFEYIGCCEGIRLLRTSSLYVTEPVGIEDQSWFVNAVCEIKTMLSPRILLEKMREIELEMGRFEKGTGGPRVIDIDILLYGQKIIETDDLVIPHPELHKRRFVLVPLNEIAPYAVHPAFGISMRGLLERLGDFKKVYTLKEKEFVH
ncbi:MAG: 2-amino-4-hydroxy-6-hydroxymethyldihydropteridine diphosphokinase [Syntrophales bacterium]|jgi:2-amino-4-hydroxy-6-hydroxymethyldihydropteridine diphosphokinase|nr:2-amino-4-hydroxy-6-hydroxymethyldihydropteridine diphosphokinase [Syntrophales bacterium]MDY0045249.1 2-amino-4-hydroxy-6-hydroxymethyldihydropteridine diphosphokinase [Syntrophales bacterium]